MPRQLDPRIAEILRTYGEDPNDQKGVIWDCHGTWVVYHRALERVAARANISFDAPTILRAERDEAVILCTARMDERVDWDIGEALINVNYKVSGKQAAYVYAMALKRGRDRLILKLTGLHGLTYSEEESDDFKPGRQQSDVGDPDKASLEFIASCKRRIADAADMATLAGWWNTEERKNAFRDFDLTDSECRELQQIVTARVEALKPRAVS